MVHVMSMDHMIPYLVFDRYIGKWTGADIGPDKWSKLSLWLHSNDSLLFGPFGPWLKWSKWSKWSWLISSFEPISGFRTGSDIDDGIPLRRFLVRHAIVILAH